jgi:hypothetical protein
MPFVAGVLTALLVWYTWGSLDHGGASHDERAYLLQARIFALGKWVAAAPPIPEFFEQMHVFVTPALASKYPPGHSLLITPGIWFGLPGLMPVVLSGVAAGLVFALARRVTNPWVALIAWTFWATSGENLRWRASYYSEMTTSVAVLLAWWSLLHWRLTNRRFFLVLLAFVTGWGAITRPLTMFAFALPIAVVAAYHILKARAWRDMAVAFAVTLGVLAILPVWSRVTTGSWREWPLVAYSRIYAPSDNLGFGLDSIVRSRELPPDLQRVADEFFALHREFTPKTVPGELIDRMREVTTKVWGHWRVSLLPFAALGLLVMPLAVGFAAGSSLLLLLAYGVYAHPAEWTVYYLESFPVLALLTALGIWRSIGFVLERSGSPATLRPGHSALAVLGLILLSYFRIPGEVRATRIEVSNTNFEQRSFREAVDNLPGASKIVFVRYAPKRVGHFSFVTNEPDLEAATSWVVYDRGAQNQELMDLAPERRAYLFDQLQRAFIEITRDGSALPPP